MDQLVELLSAPAAFVASLLVVTGGLVSLYRLLKKLDNVIGKDEHGRTISDRMSRVEYQLWQNSGDSLRDAVDQVTERQITMDAKLDIMHEIMLAQVAEKARKKPRAL